MPIDLPKVRLLFEKANKTADVRFLTREIASRMHERLSVMKIGPSDILDAGCGDGDDMVVLKRTFGSARVYGLDAACTRARRAAGYVGKTGISPGVACCGDFGSLPFPDGTFDMVWSNLALHWRDDHARVFREWRRVLRDDGLVIFSCFGEKTLELLRMAYGVAEACSHVLPFRSMQAIGDDLVGAGFSAPVLEREWITLTYTTIERLLSDVRALGGNPLSCRPAGLSGKRAFRKLLDALEGRKTAEGMLSLTFEVIYAHAFREPELRDTEKMIRLCVDEGKEKVP
ncbi:MAG: methyltransferase domain-containing protein [Oxalobacter sp.]|nr:methyltransferase domain-containing protein [Oxalobacter sp.]